MNLSKVIFGLCVLVLLLAFGEVLAIAHYQSEENLINGEDRRAADSYGKTEELKSERGVYASQETNNRHPVYPSGYGDATFSSPGHTYGPPSLTPYYPSYPSYGHSGHESVFGHSGHGVSYGSTGHEASYGHGSQSHKVYGLKALLIPLAGIALLGAAAALSTNPVLLQLGVVNGRRRRRRSVHPNAYPLLSPHPNF